MTSAIECSSNPCDIATMAAMEPAAKRAKIEVSSLHQVDFEKFSLKMGTKAKNGQQPIYPSIGGEIIRANLTPNDWLTTPWGLDFTGKYECPSFLGGAAPAKPGTPEKLSLRLNLQDGQADFLSKIDEAARKAFADLNPNSKWNPLVNYAQFMSAKVSVVLAGDGLTKLAVVKDGVVSRGQGYDFLKDFGTTFARSEVKIVVKVKKLWVMAGKAGLTLEATQLVLKPTGKPEEEDAFANDEALLA